MMRRWPRFAPRLVAAAAAVAVLCPATARADPIGLIAAGVALGFTGTAALVVGAVATYGGYVLLAANIYGGIDARRRAKAAARDATRRYNASVVDRSITALRATPPWRIVYGECITGGDIVAIFSSDKTTVSASGAAGTKPDGLKHLVIMLASHQVESIGTIYVDGVSLGTLDGSGYSTSADWTTGVAERLVTVTFSSSTSLTTPATSIVSATTLGGNNNTYDVDRTVAISGGGLTLTVTDGLGSEPVTVVYRAAVNPAVIRVQKHLGTDSQTVDTYLNSVKPTEWDSTHRLRGIAYIVVTLDLEDPRFQAGPPNITATVKGKRLYDPRLDSTNGGSGSHRADDPSTWAWSDNPALAVRDWIVGEYGMAADDADVDDAYTIAAANACDVTYNVSIGGAPDVTLAMYRCNGVATTELSREQVLDDLADSMAGFAVYGAQWQMMAGAWSSPVMALTDDDLVGQIEVVQAGAGIDELVNGVRGTYVASTSATGSDFPPYQNSTFVTADGEPYWQDVALPYTNTASGCTNIARVLVERGRNGLVITYPAKLRAWPLQVGDRVTVTSTEYGWSAKTFRVTDWQFGLLSPVTLRLQEDAADAYDTVDAVDADPTPNTGLPSPWLVEAITLGTPESGTNHLVAAGDGTISTRVWVSWSALTGAYLQDGQARVVVRWRRVGPDVDWQQTVAAADDGGTYLTGVVDGDRLVIEAWAQNALGFRGASDTATHTVVGKTAAPAVPSSFSGTISKGRIVWAWTPSAEVDYSHSEVRSANSGWGNPATPPLWRGTASDWSEPVSSVGGVTRYLRHYDTSGNYSATSASASVTVADADLIESIAALAAAAYSGQTQYVAGRAWNFQNSAESWAAGSDATITVQPSYIDVQAIGANPAIASPAGLGIYGAGFTLVRARVRRTGGSGWLGHLFYATESGHGMSGSYYKEIADATLTGEWVVLEWDMTALTAGGSDWTSSTIDQLRLDLGGSSSDDFDVDWIAVGTLAPGSYGAAFGVNIIGQAETADIAANAVTKVYDFDVEAGPITRSNIL